jgi:signal transduction histidine kinase
MTNLNFTVDSALLSELGEKLVETVHLALVELVKNSYDADASWVKIKFIPDGKIISEIHIIDNGTGMNFSDVENYWMRIATSNKLKRNFSPNFGRPRTGSKGIGRFCCRRLGKSLKLTTVGSPDDIQKRKSEYQKTVAVFPWEKFKAGTIVTDIECAGEQHVLPSAKTGTTLIISKLNDEWSIGGFNYLKRQLAVLAANRGVHRKGFQEDPGFNISIEAPQFDGKVIDLREELLDAGWGTIDAYINNKSEAVCELHALGVGHKKIVSSRLFPALNNVKLKVGILVDAKEQLRNKKILSKWSLRKILPEWGGIQIRYNGFRVYPYGDDDWLDIDHDRGLRKGSPKDQLLVFAETLKGVNPPRSLLNMLSMRNHVGQVDLGTDSEGFVMKASREGFMKTDAVDQLKEFVRFAIEWATIYRDSFLRTQAQKDTEVAREYLEEIIQEKIEPGKIVESAVEYLKKEVDNLASALPSAEKKSLRISFQHATDAIVKQENLNKEELRHLRLIASTSTLLLIFSHEVKSLLGGLEGARAALHVLESKLKGDDLKSIKNIEIGLGLSKKRFEDLLKMTSLISIDSKQATPTNLALFERIEKSVMCYQLIITSYEIEVDFKGVPKNIVIGSMLEAELYAVLLNALSNSIKSVIAGGLNKKIKIEAERDRGKTKILIKDTGIGLNSEHYQDVFTPFVADPEGKLYKKLSRELNPEDKYIVGTGSGLGLSIVKEIVQVRNGQISFVKPKGIWNAELEIII